MPTSLRHLIPLILFFSFTGKIVSAQTGSGYELISTAQGLSQGMINDMIQDKEGFIWIATKDGLNRYDGYSFKIFTTDPLDSTSLSSNWVSNLLEDSKGRIWVGTEDGLNVYDKKTGRFLRIVSKPGDPQTLSGNRIVSGMQELPDGRILVCAQGAGLNIVSLPDKINAAPIVSKMEVADNREVLGIGKDDKGNIWVGCQDHTVFVYMPSSGRLALLSDAQTVTGLIEKTGRFLSARSSRVFMEPQNRIASIGFMDSTGQLLPGVISERADGTLLLNNSFPLKPGAIGSIFYDLSSIRPGMSLKELPAFSLATNVANQTIKCLLLDRCGVLWVGTLGHGIYKYQTGSNRFRTILPNLSVQRVVVLNDHIIYVQGWAGVIAVTAAGKNIANPLSPIFGNAAFINVLKAKNGEYWGYEMVQKKLLRYTPGLKLLATYLHPVNYAYTDQMQPMIEDSRHRIWLCGADGTLAMVDHATGKLSKYVIAIERTGGKLNVAQTNAFYEDGAGVFWMGTENGFARLKFTGPEAAPEVKWFKNVPGNKNSLNYNYVSWFMDDPVDPDFLWISTKGGGLNRMQKSTGNFIHFTVKNGLPNDVVYGTLTDNQGNIWGSTNRGLFCLLAGKKGHNGEPVFRLFSTSDGLQADEFNTNAFGKMSDGDLIFCGVKGINIFDPEKVLATNFTPNVFITGIQIGNKIISPNDRTGVLKETIEKTSAITLTYLQDVLTLEFSSLDFTAPLQNKYRYQLEGIDKEWVESGTRRTATYLHLPSGNYVFKVQGSNSQGVWSDQVATLKIKVLPPWWLSWWAYLVYALLIAFTIRTYLKFNVNKARLQSQLNFEQIEAKRVKELDSIKTKLYTNITHEFRTPITVILGMAQQVVDNPSEQFGSRMDMIVRNGRNLLNLVNQLLDLSKLETGKMQLQLAKGDVIHFLRYVVESFHSLAESQQKQLHFLTDIDMLYMEHDREKLRQIISNLLSNAIKFTPEKGNIYIHVMDNISSGNAAGSLLVIKVKDTGIGIPEDQLQYVFDRFYQLDNSHTRQTEGTGIGLALTKELVKLMDGDISVKSPPAGAFKGTEFTVSLPLLKTEPVVETVPEGLPTPPVTKEPNHRETRISLPAVQEPKGNTPLILLVEDNADVVAYTASCLPDYRLAVGKDGREGFEIAIDMVPDLIITDVMMPFVDGFELVNKLRQHEHTSHIPVIMITAKADMNSKIEGLQQGADVYLEKPFNKEELLVRIRKLLEMRNNLQQYYLKKAGIDGGKHPETIVAPEKAEAIEDGFVKRVREAVEQNLTDVNFSVEKLSKLIFMSHSQLHRKLDALTGCSPNRFIRMIRLKKARELLRDPANSIGSVALDCGYNDPGYFARVFKQEYGVTPQEWRVGDNSF